MTTNFANAPIPSQILIAPAKKSRNATFELVRIIAMIFIISSHFYGHGGWREVTDPAGKFFMSLTHALFLPSVNVFVMISAYFICLKDDFKIPFRKLGKLWLQVFFYGMTLYIVFVAAGVYNFDALDFVGYIFPILSGKYWFISAYFLMSVASPFLNVLIKKLNKAQYLFVCVFIIATAVLHDVQIFENTMPLKRGYTGWWFCLLYLLAGYIRKYDVKLTKPAWIPAIIGFVAIVIYTAVLEGYMPFNISLSYTSLGTLYMSVIILVAAKSIKIENAKAAKIICFVSKLTFGVYLIHDNNELRGFMYEKIFHSSRFLTSDVAYLIYVGFVLLTFIVCAAIEWIRQIGFDGVDKLVHKLFGGKLKAAQAAVSGKIKALCDRINATDASAAE